MHSGHMQAGESGGAARALQRKPLAGVRVLAAEQMQALPMATQLLSHLGARVTKIEAPGRGESGRHSNPYLTDEKGRRVGATFLRHNLSKQSIAINLKREAGRNLVKRLAPHFDVFAENFRAGAMAQFALGYEELSAANPRLIYLSISGFGQLGEHQSPYVHWPAYAPVAEAMGGLYEPTRKPGKPPQVVPAGALGDNAAALYAVIGVLAALRHREQTGLGQHVDIAMLDAMVAMADMVPFLHSMGAPAHLAGPGTTALVAAFRARDGYFVVAVLREAQFEKLCQLLGRTEWLADPRFADRTGWAKHTEDVIRPAIENWAQHKSKLEASAALCEAGIAAGPSQRAQDVSADPHMKARHMLIAVPRPDGKPPYLTVGNPVKLSRVQEGPVQTFPRLGEHTDEVLREVLKTGTAELSALREAGAIE